MSTFAFISYIEMHWLAVLADAAVKGLIVLLVAAGATLLLRRSSAALRHMVWTLAVAALILMPILSIALPQFHVPLLPDWSGTGDIAQASPSTPAASPAANIERSGTPESPTVIGSAGPRPTDPMSASELPRGDWASTIGRSPTVPSDELAEAPWSTWVLLAWLAGAVVLLLPLLAGTATAWWQTRHAERIESGSWASLLSNLCGQLGICGRIVLLRSDWANIPFACGIFRRTIILPAEADDWPIDRRKVVLLHELAHIRRADCLTQLLARLARVIYWFNPLVWLAGRMLRIERERACDDLVLACGHKASDYARHLLDIARSLHSLRCPSLAAVAMARKSHFEGRLLAILDPRRNRSAITRRRVLIAAVLAVACIVPLASFKTTAAERPPAITPAKPAETTTSPGARAARAPSIGIYMVTGRPKGTSFEKTPLGDFTLAADPLVSEADIFTYDWGTHTIRLKTQAVADRVLNRKGRGGYFVVVVDGERLYRGAMVSLLTSMIPSAPSIKVGRTADQWQPKFAIRIFPPPRGVSDPRGDNRLKRALQTLNKLSNTVDRSPAAAAKPASDGPWETTEAFLAAVANSKDRDAMRMTDPSSAVARQVKDFRELPGLKGMSIARMHADEASALGATKPFELVQKGRKKTVLIQLALIKSRGLWLISDIDLETPESAKAELAEFLRLRPNAIPDVKMVPAVHAPGLNAVKPRPLDSVIWEKPQRGWQVGAKLLSTSDKLKVRHSIPHKHADGHECRFSPIYQFQVGDSIVIQYLLKNVTTEKRSIVLEQIESTHAVLGSDNWISLIISGSSQNQHQHTLAPGEVMEQRQYRVTVNTQGMLPGVYRLNSGRTFWEVKKNQPRNARSIGTQLPIPIELSDPTRETATVYSKPPIAKNPAEKIHWGRRVGGLIVGMRLKNGRTRWSNESLIEAGLFIRNVAHRTVDIAYQGPVAGQWSMHVQTKDGKDVHLTQVRDPKMRNLPPIRESITRHLTLKPGEQACLTATRNADVPKLEVVSTQRPPLGTPVRRLTTKQGSYTWMTYINVTQKNAPGLTMHIGSGVVPFEIIEPVNTELNYLKVSQLESIAKCKATVEKITPCSVHLKTNDGRAISLAGPGGADRPILDFMKTLKKGQTYTLPDAFIEFRKKHGRPDKTE